MDHKPTQPHETAFNFYFSQLTMIAFFSVMIGVLLFLFLCLGFKF